MEGFGGEIKTAGGMNTSASCVERSDVKENKKTYDKYFKKFFKRRSVLAAILKDIVEEYRGLCYNEVLDLIPADSSNEEMAYLKAESNINEGGTILLDILVESKIPNSDGVVDTRLIFDLEMQRNFNPGYSIFSRAQYYASRLLAEQSVKNSDYDKLNPVYSTWICMNNIPVSSANTHVSFEFSATDSQGDDVTDRFVKKRLINIDFLLISAKYDYNEDDPEVVKFLQGVFKGRMDDKKFNPYVTVVDSMKEEVEGIMGENDDFLNEMRYMVSVGEARNEARVRLQSVKRLLNKIKTYSMRGMSAEEYIKNNLISEPDQVNLIKSLFERIEGGADLEALTKELQESDVDVMLLL